MPRGVRHIRDSREPRRRATDVSRALRAAASRAGERGHRDVGRRDGVPAQGDGAGEPRVRRGHPREAAGARRHRARPLLDDRAEQAHQRAADSRAVPRRDGSRRRTTATSSTRTACARTLESEGLHLQDDDRHRDDPASGRARVRSAARTREEDDNAEILERGARGRRGRVLDRVHDRRTARRRRGTRAATARSASAGSKSGGWAVASESCALDIVDAELEREVEAGGDRRLDELGAQVLSARRRRRPEELLHLRVHLLLEARLRHRRRLGRPRQARTSAANARARASRGRRHRHLRARLEQRGRHGIREESGIPLEIGLIRNHYIGRTFIHPKQSLRD